MDLRQRFEGALRRWGHDVFLQRQIQSRGSGVFALRENSGFTNQLEKHTTRHRWPNQSGSIVGVTQENIEGLVADVDLIFYFKWDVNPKMGDRIYDKNPNGFSTYIIDFALPLRFQNGRIEYWITGATIENGPNDA